MHNLNLLAILVAAISTMLVGFIWYSPILFAKPWMREMGYDPNDKATAEKMRKSAGPGLVFARDARPIARNRLACRLPRMARLRRHGATHQRPVHKTKHEALCNQHRLPARLLPSNVRHPYRLEIDRGICAVALDRFRRLWYLVFRFSSFESCFDLCASPSRVPAGLRQNLLNYL